MYPKPNSVVKCNTTASCQTKFIISKVANHKQKRNMGNFDHLFGVVKKDWEFLKKGVDKSVKWANEHLHVPKIAKKVDDVIWLRNLENPNSPPFQPPFWPQPSYPALSGMDLLMADIEALAAYGSYFYRMTKVWQSPLPEVYDAEVVSDYFNCRPHVVALRLIEVFAAFSSAVIKIRASRIGRHVLRTDEDGINSLSQFDFGKVLKETMLNLGPTFIKVGQSLSTRPDIIGSDISKALSELHDQIPPFPRAIAMKIIEDELGAPVERFFSHISDEPVGAASFGQVYRGTTYEGYAVAIKIQRPNLHHVVARDIYILRLGLGLLKKIAERKNDIRLYADELGKGLMGELDYRLEAANASRFLEAHSSFPFIHVPKVYPQFTRKKVLTMEWLAGDNPTDLLLACTGAKDNSAAPSEKQAVEAKQRLLDLVNKGVEASLVQLLETGFMHADPHPGNLRYTSTGQIGFLDFGLMCQMERKHQLAMLASIIHIVNGDWASLVQALSEMDVIVPGTNTRLVTMELENTLGEVEFIDGIPDVKFSKVLGNIWSVAFKYNFRMPTYYTLLLRSLASLEGLAIAANDKFKTFEAAYPYVVHKLLTDNSDASRRILHSVILNKRREFQWTRLVLFLRVGATRKLLPVLESANDGLSGSSSSNDNIFNVATFVLKLLPSKDGTVLRRLLMTADGASLLKAFLSPEAAAVRQQFCRATADVLYQWMAGNIVKDPYLTTSSNSFAANCKLLIADRRLKVVFNKILNDAKRDWLLMLRFYGTSFVMFVIASAMACHRLMISLSKSHASRLSFSPIQAVVST
uniref:Protein kinase domain-containing protein n=2 Tax=Chenopodium quinoa TaxID=63459 RepID=A0A803N621_CHEQI